MVGGTTPLIDLDVDRASIEAHPPLSVRDNLSEVAGGESEDQGGVPMELASRGGTPAPQPDIGLLSDVLDEAPAPMNLSAHQYLYTTSVIGEPRVEEQEWYLEQEWNFVNFLNEKFGPPQIKAIDLTVTNRLTLNDCMTKRRTSFMYALPTHPRKIHWKKQLLHHWEEEAKTEDISTDQTTTHLFHLY